MKVLHHGGVKDDGGDEGSGGDVLAISEPFMSIREQNISDFVNATGGRCSRSKAKDYLGEARSMQAAVESFNNDHKKWQANPFWRWDCFIEGFEA